jgi:glycosyltransferase involved in cell wall biosynthesis
MRSRRLTIISHEYYPVLCGGTVFAEKMALEWSAMGYEVEILTSGIGSGFARREQTGPFRVRRFWTGRRSLHDAKLAELLAYFALGLPQMLFHLARNRPGLLFSIFAIPSGMIGVIAGKLLRIPHFNLRGRRRHARHRVGAEADHGVPAAGLPLGHAGRHRRDHPPGHRGRRRAADLEPARHHHSQRHRDPRGDRAPRHRPGRLEILSIGRIVLRKGFQQILEALALLAAQRQDFHLTIVGYGTHEEELREALRSRGLEPFITLVGRVEYAKLKVYYLQSDCYLFYGAREGSSLAMIEALSYGLPIVASDDPGTRAYVVPGENGDLVEHLRPDKLAAALQRLLDNRADIPRLGERSREIAMQYSWANIARRYDRFFHETA